MMNRIDEVTAAMASELLIDARAAARAALTRGVDDRPRACDQAVAYGVDLFLDIRLGDIDREPGHVFPLLAEHLDDRVGVASPNGVGDARDPAAKALDSLEHDDAVADRRVRGRVPSRDVVAGDLREPFADPLSDEKLAARQADDVAENCPGLDGRELPGVADEDQSRIRSYGFQEPTHERERDHRRLVDDHHVVGQAVAAGMSEAAVAVRSPAEEAVKRGGLELGELRANPVAHRQRERLLADGLLEPGGRLAGLPCARALHRLAGHSRARRSLSRGVIQNSVGTRFEFAAADSDPVASL